MTIRTIKAALLSAVVLASGMAATSANAATATATARANILRQLTVTRTADLDFGTIVTGAAAATVAVSSGGARTCGAGLTCTGTVSAANFNVVGTVGSVVTTSVGGTVTLTSGGNNMTATLAGSGATITLDGTDDYAVGGTLSVGANQADGVYTGTFTATVNYQ